MEERVDVGGVLKLNGIKSLPTRGQVGTRIGGSRPVGVLYRDFLRLYLSSDRGFFFAKSLQQHQYGLLSPPARQGFNFCGYGFII